MQHGRRVDAKVEHGVSQEVNERVDLLVVQLWLLQLLSEDNYCGISLESLIFLAYALNGLKNIANTVNLDIYW